MGGSRMKGDGIHGVGGAVRNNNNTRIRVSYRCADPKIFWTNENSIGRDRPGCRNQSRVLRKQVLPSISTTN
jgi:hypothetical protein